MQIKENAIIFIQIIFTGSVVYSVHILYSVCVRIHVTPSEMEKIYSSFDVFFVFNAHICLWLSILIKIQYSKTFFFFLICCPSHSFALVHAHLVCMIFFHIDRHMKTTNIGTILNVIFDEISMHLKHFFFCS